MLGKLSWQALNNGPIVLGGDITLVLVGLAVFGVLTYTKRWKWLWKEWLTSLDPKKIGVMYVIVAIIMLLRGLADVLLLRAQQATASGSQGIISSDQFQQVFSAHGSIMIFFVAMGLVFGIL